MRTIFLLLLTFIFSISQAQLNKHSDASISGIKNKDVALDSQKGSFHIAIQDFTFGITTGRFSLSSLSLRAGYSFTNKDIAYLSGRYTWNPRAGYSDAIETAIFYRRYFTDGPFQPFAQLGAGLGYILFSEDYDSTPDHKFYGIVNAGAGVAFRYKRWGFELGIQSGYNQYSTGRITLAPIVGVSFSF